MSPNLNPSAATLYGKTGGVFPGHRPTSEASGLFLREKRKFVISGEDFMVRSHALAQPLLARHGRARE